QKLSSASFVSSFVPPPIDARRMRKDQKPASINAYLSQKGKVAEAKAARDILAEQDDALHTPIQQDVGGVDVALGMVEGIALPGLPAVVRVQVPPATRNQLVVPHSGEPRKLPTIGAGKWLACVAASRGRLADQADLVRLDLFLSLYCAKSQ